MIELLAQSSGGGPQPGHIVIGVAVIGAIGMIVAALLKRRSDKEQIAFEKHKHSADQRKDAKEDFVKASTAMGTVKLKDADLGARKEEAGKARVALQAIAVTHRHLLVERRFRELSIALDDPTEENLGKATELWRNVEQTILLKWPEAPK